MLREAIGGLVIAFDRVFDTRNDFFCSAVDHLLATVRIKSVSRHICVISVEIFEARVCDQAVDQIGCRKVLHGCFLAQENRNGGKR